MLITNGEALHVALLPARERLRAVFLGHLHRGSQVIRDGITYISAAATAWQYTWFPWEATPHPDHDVPPAYHVVQYAGRQVIVCQYGFAG